MPLTKQYMKRKLIAEFRIIYDEFPGDAVAIVVADFASILNSMSVLELRKEYQQVIIDKIP